MVFILIAGIGGNPQVELDILHTTDEASNALRLFGQRLLRGNRKLPVAVYKQGSDRINYPQ